MSYYALDVLGCSYGWLRSSDIFADATEETIPPESVARRDVDISTYHGQFNFVRVFIRVSEKVSL